MENQFNFKIQNSPNSSTDWKSYHQFSIDNTHFSHHGNLTCMLCYLSRPSPTDLSNNRDRIISGPMRCLFLS